jgi:hypothetical protein
MITTRELLPIYDNAKSFYKKAMVMHYSDNGGNNLNLLYSYETLAASIDTIKGRISVYNLESRTTTRHVKEFIRQYTFRAYSTQEIKRLFYVTSSTTGGAR